MFVRAFRHIAKQLEKATGKILFSCFKQHIPQKMYPSPKDQHSEHLQGWRKPRHKMHPRIDRESISNLKGSQQASNNIATPKNPTFVGCFLDPDNSPCNAINKTTFETCRTMLLGPNKKYL